MKRRQVVTLTLLAVGLALLLAGALLWRQTTEDQDQARLAAQYERAVLLDQGREDLAATVDVDPEAERSWSVLALVLGAAGTAAGLALVARERPRP